MTGSNAAALVAVAAVPLLAMMLSAFVKTSVVMSLDSSLCVPTTISTVPSAMPSRAAFTSLAVRKRAAGLDVRCHSAIATDDALRTTGRRDGKITSAARTRSRLHLDTRGLILRDDRSAGIELNGGRVNGSS